MGRKLTTILAAGAMLGSMALLPGTARAQDVYMKLLGGWTIPQDQDFDLRDETSGVSVPNGLDFDSGYALGAAVGFTYSPNVAIEAEYTYRKSEADWKETDNEDSGDVVSNAFMLNAFYKFVPDGSASPFRPYVGAGLGVGDFSVKQDDLKLESDYSFAYQAMLGLSYEVSLQGSLFAEVRYFGASSQTVEDDDFSFSSGYDAINVLVGYTYTF
jgi:opacity protein-like surface antigen